MTNANGPHQAGVAQIIKTLNPQFLPLFLSHLDAAGQVLKNYRAELEQIQTRMNKFSSDPSTRSSLGEAELQLKIASLTETLSKLEAHKIKSLRRLNG